MAVRREDIEKKSLFYTILRPYVDLVTKTYFRTKTHNYKNVPKDEIVVFALNHQNALMDALAILATVHTEPVFLARADIFKKKTIGKILTFLRILPIYRIRDGKENLGNNDAIFQKTIDVLKNKNGLVILPEGNHAGFRKLRTLKKGISRIVFEAEESNDFKLNIKIVPVGLDWSNYINFRSRLFVNYGEPISVSEYYDEYKKNAPRGMNMLRERIAKELKKYMIHIENDEYYDMFDAIRYVYLPDMIKKMGLRKVKQPNSFYAQKEIIKKLNNYVDSNPDKVGELNEKTKRYSELLKKLNFRHWVIQKDGGLFATVCLKIILAILLFPIYICGAILNYLPYKVPVLLTKKIKDPQFVSSVRNVIALIVFLVYYFILFIVGAFVLDPWWMKLLFFIATPFAGLFAFHYFIHMKKIFAQLRYKIKTMFKNKELIELKECYQFVCKTMDSVTK
ncbi:MAG: 1-acyl-sn-glycerol-3-phosphate acyltransferase [Bacteroidales bacterium]|nr:1-acyl-sn-glycerol-3-phosphate acyltransferase [Bacteroidales bacterium]